MAARKHPKPLTVAAALTEGRREALMAMASELAEMIDAKPGGVLPQLTAELRKVLAELDDLPVDSERSASDELADARARRLAAARAAASSSS